MYLMYLYNSASSQKIAEIPHFSDYDQYTLSLPNRDCGFKEVCYKSSSYVWETLTTLMYIYIVAKVRNHKRNCKRVAFWRQTTKKQVEILDVRTASE